MDLINLIKTVGRRWYVVAPILACGLLLAVAVGKSIAPDYSATGAFIVVTRTAEEGAVSPEVVAEAIQDAEVRDRIRAEHPGTYSVNADDAGVLRVVASAATSADAVEITNAVLQELTPVAAKLAQGSEAPPIQVLNRPISGTNTGGGYQASGSARFLGGEGGLDAGDAARLLPTLLSSSAVKASVTRGSDTDYVLTTDKFLPTVTIEATGTNPKAVLATVGRLLDASNAQINALSQLTVAGPAPVVAKELGRPNSVSKDTQGIFRSMIVLLAITIGVAIAAALALEGYAESRARRGAVRPFAVQGSRAGAFGSRPLRDRTRHPPDAV
jgi:hypothetical protein